MAANKLRIDQYLVDHGLAESRTRAQDLIKARLVLINGRAAEKAGQLIAPESAVSLIGNDHPWVSRGGIKLAHALDVFGIDVSGKVAIDVGSSTGGFTDVLLQNGTVKVFAVDCGTNQLAQKLRQNPNVVMHEQTNARILTDAHITDPIDLIVCDASFISLSKVLERPMRFATQSAQLIALIKPQFEAGRAALGKGGVVRDPAVHARVCRDVSDWLVQAGWHVRGLIESPITGPQGNIEFLIWASNAVDANNYQ